MTVERQDSPDLHNNAIGLTAQEQAALDSGKDPAAVAAEAAAADPAAVAAAAAAAAAADPAAAAAATTAAAADPAAAAATATGTAAAAATLTAPQGVFAPNLAPTDTRDYAAEQTALEAKLIALNTQSRSGEIDDDDYETQREALIKEQRTLDREQVKAETKAELAATVTQQTWTTNRDLFLQQPENAIISRSPENAAIWATMMHFAVNEAAAAGKQLSDWEILTLGRDKMLSAMQIKPGAAVVAGDGRPNRDPKLGTLIPGVGGAPAAGANGGKTTVDELVGGSIQDVEAFFASQTDDQRTALLKSVPGSFADGA